MDLYRPAPINPCLLAAKSDEDKATGNKNKIADAVVDWLRGRYILGRQGSLPKALIFDEYKKYCRSKGWEPSSAAGCGRLVHKAFPNIVCIRKGSRKSMKYHYQHLCYRSMQAPASCSSPLTTKSEQQPQPQQLLQPLPQRRSFQVGLFADHAASFDLYENDGGGSQEFIKKEQCGIKTACEVEAEVGQLKGEDNGSDHSEEEDTTGYIRWGSLCIWPSAELAGDLNCFDDFAPLSTTDTQQQQQQQKQQNTLPQQAQQQPGATNVHRAKDPLQSLFDGYLQDLFKVLVTGQGERVKQVLHTFWRKTVVEYHHNMTLPVSSACARIEHATLMNLLDSLLANPLQMEQPAFADWLHNIACALPIWIQEETMYIMPRDYLLNQRCSLSLFAMGYYEKVNSVRGQSQFGRESF